MPASTPRNPFADLLRAHAVPLTHLDPAAPLDDLEPLRDIIGYARVVALGENSHFITEFSLLRRRILRFLAERCGFTVLAFEYGFSEGFPSTPGPRARGRTTTWTPGSPRPFLWESRSRCAGYAGTTPPPRCRCASPGSTSPRPAARCCPP